MPEPKRQIITRNGKAHELPLFLPVYQPKSNLVPIDDLKSKFAIDGMIVNGFFLYKDADVKAQFEAGQTLHRYIGFDGLIMTDSGAFQGLKRPLYLSNKKIVKFQDQIRADIVSPLDLISAPGDNRQTAQKKLLSTIKRIREAKNLVQNGILAGVQQGGRYLELRKQSMEALMEIDVDYVAIGSLVPFFNKNHNMVTVIKILRDARNIAGNDLPFHVYGAGDPVELPFIAALGTDIFDSSSYGHYAVSGWYMTLYGALQEKEKEKITDYGCQCDACSGLEDVADIFRDTSKLAAHNLHVILDTIRRIRAAQAENRMEPLLTEILEIHARWFPDSLLNRSWEENCNYGR
jgi:7-cyano-7-deazaguanine tRNA-ribosyltransferase